MSGAPVSIPSADLLTRQPIRHPDMMICFSGSARGYGSAARAVVDLDRLSQRIKPISPFRYHRPQRRLTLAGDVPVREFTAVAGLARIGAALGMQTACTLRLPHQLLGRGQLRALTAAGRLGILVLDVSTVTAQAVGRLRTEVAEVLRDAAALGLEVEVYGPVPVIRAAGVLDAATLDRDGVTIRPDAAPPLRRVGDPVLIVLSVEGDWYADEASWRRGDPPIGSVHDRGSLERTLRALVDRQTEAVAVGPEEVGQ